MLSTAYSISPGHFVLYLVLLAVLATWVYWHASRHGSKHATAWAVLTFLSPIVLLVYFIHFFRNRRRF